ncbi:MAG TPA: hypothetical protein VEG39_04000 [Clostridia bacterium]|nr:hypothetical protein [Clostridia bacterium]
MKIEVNRYGIVEDYLMPRTVVAYEGAAVTRNFLDFIYGKYGPGIKEQIMHNEQIREGVIILLNGRNIKSHPDGLDAHIKDGDVITIGILAYGG